MAQPTPETLLAMARDRIGGGRNNGGKWLADQLRDNRYTEEDARAVMLQFTSEIGGGDGPGAYTEREALATLRAAYRRPAREPWKTGGEGPDQWRERKARRQRQAFPTGPPPATAPQPDPKSVEGFLRRRKTCKPIADTPAEEYLTQRGIPADLARAAKCAYSPSWGRILAAVVFPIRDQDGKPIAANARAITPMPEGSNTKQTFGPMAGGVFCTPGALDADPVGITEAPIDALTLHLAGLPTIATCGTSNLPEWVKARLATPAPDTPPGYSRTVYVAHDNDQPGELAAARIGASLTLAKVHRLRPCRKDWNADLTAGGLDALREWLESEGVHPDSTQKRAADHTDRYTKNRPPEQNDNRTTVDDSCGPAPADSLTDTQPPAESNPSGVFCDSMTLDQPTTVEHHGTEQDAAEVAALADQIRAELEGRPRPIRIGPGETISDLDRFATATARDLLGRSAMMARAARDRLDQLGITLHPQRTPGDQ